MTLPEDPSSPSYPPSRTSGWRLVCVVAAIAAAALSGCGKPSPAQLLDSAQARIDKKDFAGAVVDLKTALQADPQSGRARYLLGEALLRNGDANGAELELGKARDQGYDDNLVTPKLARAMLVAGKAKAVVDLFSNVTLKDSKAGADLKSTLARAQWQLGNLDKSASFVLDALQLDPKNVDARFLQARQAATRSIEEAMTLVTALIADAPDRPEVHHLKGQLLWLGQRNADGAIPLFQEAIKREPKHLPSYRALAAIWLQKKDVEHFREQVKALEKALPKHPETQFFLAQVALLDKDLQKSRDIVQQLLKSSPNNVMVKEFAGALELNAGRLVVAETHLKKVLVLAPDRTQARTLLAETYVRLKQPERALAALQPLLQSGQRVEPGVLALAAEATLLQGDLPQAESLFNRAAKADPNDPKSKTALALMRMAKGDDRAGYSQLESVAEVDQSSYADLALISARLQQRDFDAALVDVDRLVRKSPGKPMSHQLRGDVLMQKGDTANARASYEKALSLDATYMPAAIQLANMDLADKQPQAAVKRFETILQKDPRNYRAQLGIAEVRLRSGTPAAELTEQYRQVVKANPSDAFPRQALIQHFVSMGDNKNALASAQEAVSALPDDLQLLELLGRAQLNAGDYQQAISSFGKLAAARPEQAEPQLLIAEVHLRRDDRVSAGRSMRRALEINPEFLPAQVGLVKLALYNKQYDEAVGIARSVQKAQPTKPTGFVLESDIHAARRAWGPAIDAALLALQKRKSTPLAGKLVGLYFTADRRQDAERFIAQWEREYPKDSAFQNHLGALAMGRKDNAQAEARFRRALDLRPDDASAANNVAWLLVEQGKPGAVAFARRANELTPDRPALMDTLARALAAEKSWDEAARWQLKAVQKVADNPTYRLSLAKIYVGKGDKDAARKELETLAKLGSKFPQQDEVQKLTKSL